ncbi:MAG: flagellar basal body P-ring formation protein FlgA [Deltaproteobacteria bacterium]|nr:flagellar basal body P-ring formation protein FlgA [Deltaproteobacteria bacterium]
MYLRPSRRGTGALGLIILLMAAGISLAQDVPQVNVVVSPKSTVTGSEIYLRDVADISGEDTRLTRPLADLLLMTAPPVGQSLLLERTYLISKVKRIQDLNCEVTISMPEEVSIFRTGLTVTADQITALAKQHILDRTSWPKDKMTIDNLRAKDILIPNGEVDLVVTPKSGENYLGQVSLPISVMVNGKEYRKVFATCVVEVRANVLIAKHSIERIREVTSDMVKLTEKNLAGIPEGYFENVDQVVGKQLKRSIKAGEIIKTSDVLNPCLVKKGDVVEVILENKNIILNSKGRAEQSGRAGEMIKMTNTSSKKEFYGRVMDGGTVRVEM